MLHKRSSCSSSNLLFFCFCYCIFSLIIYRFLTFPLSDLMKEVQGKPFGQRSDRLTTYRHKVHEYLNSLYIFRFSWTAQSTWPNLMIIHTWFRGLGQVSDVLKPLCVGVHGIRIKLALQRKHKGSKENTFIKKKSLSFLLYCLLLISFVQNIWTIYARKNKTCLT